jgi:hypothetical protein
MTVKVQGSSSGNIAEVNASNEIKTALTLSSADAGFAVLAAESHPTENGVAREIYELECNDDYALRATQEALMFAHVFAGAAVNTGIFRQGNATATITQAGGVITLNAGNSTTSGHAAVISSYQFAENTATSNLYCSMVGSFAVGAHPANCTVEWGLATFNAGAGTGTTEPTDGIYFRVTAGGTFEGVVRANGADIGTTGAIVDFATLVGGNTTRDFLISVSDRNVRFWIDNQIVGRIQLPSSAPTWTWTNTYSVFARLHNTGAVSGSAQQIRLAEVAIKRDNVADTRPLAHAMSALGQHAYQGQTGETLGTTASYANSADPAAAATLSNTAALVTGLGGQARFNAAGTAVLDGIVTSYQVPAATSAIPGKSLYITGIKISAANLGAAVATTATTLAWSLAFGHSAVSLATAEAATTKAPRRVALGLMTWPVGAAIGQMPQNGDLYMKFDAPICVHPGEFVATVAKFIVGTATASQVIWAHVTIDGYRA